MTDNKSHANKSNTVDSQLGSLAKAGLQRRTFLRGAGSGARAPVARSHAAPLSRCGRRRQECGRQSPGEAARPHGLSLHAQRRDPLSLGAERGRRELHPLAHARAVGPRKKRSYGAERPVAASGLRARRRSRRSCSLRLSVPDRRASVQNVRRRTFAWAYRSTRSQRPGSAITRRCRRWNWASTAVRPRGIAIRVTAVPIRRASPGRRRRPRWPKR